MGKQVNSFLQELRVNSLNDFHCLETFPQAISLSYIAAQCGKSKAWLSQRLNGNTVNKKEARFTAHDVKMFQDALHDLGRKLLNVSLI